MEAQERVRPLNHSFVHLLLKAKPCSVAEEDKH